jgi:heme oxygenase
MNSTFDGAGDADVLAALRHATASRHEALDSGLPLSQDNAGLADYVSHLLLMQAWLAPLQAWLDGFADGPQDLAVLPPTDRLALIEADLADPSLAAAGLRCIGDNPPAPAWARNASAAYRWGVCYVIEGSQLGGSVLYQRLHQRLAPHPLRFLAGAAGGPGPRWRVFMQALRANVRSRADIAEACAGACDAFDVILALAFPTPA